MRHERRRALTDCRHARHALSCGKWFERVPCVCVVCYVMLALHLRASSLYLYMYVSIYLSIYLSISRISIRAPSSLRRLRVLGLGSNGLDAASLPLGLASALPDLHELRL